LIKQAMHTRHGGARSFQKFDSKANAQKVSALSVSWCCGTRAVERPKDLRELARLYRNRAEPGSDADRGWRAAKSSTCCPAAKAQRINHEAFGIAELV
jgi:hypothetical protein